MFFELFLKCKATASSEIEIPHARVGGGERLAKCASKMLNNPPAAVIKHNVSFIHQRK